MPLAFQSMGHIDIDKPKYDMDTYVGRAKHFFRLTNPLNLLATNAQLEEARRVVEDYRAGQSVPRGKSIDDIWRAKYLYDSAFHPETGKKMFLPGRMAAQMPMNTFITANMVIFYKTMPQVVFWQWVNQTFNAVVNYTNRSGKSPISQGDLMIAYFSATFGALATAFSLKSLTKSMPPIFGRLVPFAAVAAANCVNLPLMRQNELKSGVALLDNKGREVGLSQKAAAIGIAQVVCSRIFMAIPGMTFTPLLVNHLEKKGFFKKHPKMTTPIQAGTVGGLLLFATPLGCAFFRQQTSIKVSNLEPKVRDEIQRKHPNLEEVYYNKGL